MTDEQQEDVGHQQHYAAMRIQPIQIIEMYELGFHLGNVIKYVLRSDKKGEQLRDLQKARWYINRAIQVLEDDPIADPPLGHDLA